MKHTTIKQTLTTLCILTTITLSAQVIDRFPHVESFEGGAESSSWNVCPGTNCIPIGGLYDFVISNNSVTSQDGSAYIESHTYTNGNQTYNSMSTFYDFSCLNDPTISFYYISSKDDLALEYSVDGASWTNIWTGPKADNWEIAEPNIDFLAGMDNVIFRFIALRSSSIDLIKVGRPGNTIDLSFGYDEAGNREGATLIISLQETEIIEYRIYESNVIDNFPEINVFPNPTSDFVTISIKDKNLANLRILNKLGDIIKEDSFIQDYKYSFANLPNGSYFVQIEINGVQTTYKIIKLR